MRLDGTKWVKKGIQIGKKKITSFKTNLVAIYIYKNVKFWRFNFSNFLKSVSGAQKWIHPAELRWNQADNALGCEMVALLAGKSCLLRNSIYMACTIQPSKEGRCSGNKVPGIMSRCLVMPTFFFFAWRSSAVQVRYVKIAFIWAYLAKFVHGTPRSPL